MKNFILFKFIFFCSILNAQITWTGNTDADWGTASNWNSNVVPTSSDSVYIGCSSCMPVLDVDRSVGDILIEAGGSLDLSSNNIRIYGDFTNNGTIVTTGSTIIFEGAAIQSIRGTQTFNNIEINNSNGVEILSGQTSITGELTLVLGTFDTNDSLVLVSNSLGTASILEINGSADIIGDVEIQRYIDASSTNWHFFALPIQGGSFNDWNDDIITTGIIGSNYPNWPSASNPWANIYRYDETITNNVDSGFYAPATMSESINDGEGFWTWCGDSISGTQPFMLDVKGPIFKGDFNMPVTFTSSGNMDDDGWNMVGNPYPSTIDWDNVDWVKTNVDDALYIYDPENLQYASYVSGVPNNGGSQYIASSQGFWVKTSANNPVLTAKEGVKTSVNTLFFKQSPSLPFNINVTKGQYTDQVSFNANGNATMNYDAHYDAYKVYSTSFDVPSICAISDDNNELSINSFNINGSISIPIKVTSYYSGLAQLNFNNVSELYDFNCAYLEDTQTGVFIDIFSSTGYTFMLSNTTTTSRFILHLDKVVADFNTIDTVYLSVNNGEYAPTNTSINANQYAWDFGDNNTSTAVNPIHNFTQSGTYIVSLLATLSQNCTDVNVKQVEVISTPLSIEKLKTANLKVYPNPIKVGNALTLEFEELGDYNIVLFDLTGRRVIEKEISNQRSFIPIDGDFNAGVYQLSVLNKNTNMRKEYKLSIIN